MIEKSKRTKNIFFVLQLIFLKFKNNLYFQIYLYFRNVYCFLKNSQICTTNFFHTETFVNDQKKRNVFQI